MNIENQNQAIVDRIAHLQRTASSTQSGIISREFRKTSNNAHWLHETLKRLEDMGILKMSSHRGNEICNYFLTEKGWKMAGGAPLWFMEDAA